MANLALPDETLQRLRDRLPHGWQKLVLAELAKGGLTFSPATLTMNLQGERTNLDVLNAMRLVANNYQNQLRALKEGIEEIGQSATAA